MDNLEQYDYQNKEFLGQGSFGQVFKILNVKDKKYYVLKQIFLNKLKDDQINLVENESNILKSINHGNIVKYINSFKEKTFYSIIMEYCDNSDLLTYIENIKKENKLIDPNVIYIIIEDICLGLNEIHGKNLIHRDLKPENIFIDKDYKIKIGDFGVSKQLIGTIHAKTLAGTSNYMAPEIIKGEKYTNKVDIWSLGCIIYELCTLNLCFECEYEFGLLNKIIQGQHGKINLNIYDIEYQNLIDLLLNINHEKRPDIKEVLNFINVNAHKLRKNGINAKESLFARDKISCFISKRDSENNITNNEIIDNHNFSNLNILLKMYLILKTPNLNIYLSSINNLSEDVKKGISEICNSLEKYHFLILSTLNTNNSNKDIFDLNYSMNTELIEQMLKNELNNHDEKNVFEISKFITLKELDILCNSLNVIFKKEQINLINNLDIHNQLFSEEMENAFKNSIFEYKIVQILIVDRESNEYMKEKSKCSNRVTKLLFHGTIIRVLTAILSSCFRKSSFGINGVYFTDILDYCSYFCSERRRDFGKIPKVGEFLSCVACEIYYDNNKLERIYEFKGRGDEVQKNGIICSYNDSECSILSEEKVNQRKQCIFNEYVISKNEQILPLYGLILKRVEYLVIWRDYNFNEKNPNNYESSKFSIIKEFHKKIQNLIALMYDSKVYYINQSDEALDLIDKKKYNKIIIITNGNNNGKEFIINARKIIGANTIAAVSTFNPKSHINWIKDMKNVILLNGVEFHQKFFKCIMEKSIKELNDLRADIIKKNRDISNFDLKEFDGDLFNFVNFKNEGNFRDLKFK